MFSKLAEVKMKNEPNPAKIKKTSTSVTSVANLKNKAN